MKKILELMVSPILSALLLSGCSVYKNVEKDCLSIYQEVEKECLVGENKVIGIYRDFVEEFQKIEAECLIEKEEVIKTYHGFVEDCLIKEIDVGRVFSKKSFEKYHMCNAAIDLDKNLIIVAYDLGQTGTPNAGAGFEITGIIIQKGMIKYLTEDKANFFFVDRKVDGHITAYFDTNKSGTLQKKEEFYNGLESNSNVNEINVSPDRAI